MEWMLRQESTSTFEVIDAGVSQTTDLEFRFHSLVLDLRSKKGVASSRMTTYPKTRTSAPRLASLVRSDSPLRNSLAFYYCTPKMG